MGETDTGQAIAGEATVVLIEHTLPGERLDRYLAARLPHVSRGGVQRLMGDQLVLVDGQEAKPTQHPKAGQRVEVFWPVPKEASVQPEDIPLHILFEDEDLVVVNKQSGMSIHPGSGNDTHTLVNALLHHCAGSLSGIGGTVRPGIVHRLDKDTTGCLVAAKSDASHMSLAEQFKERQVEKLYHAVLCGELPFPEGEIDEPISRHPSHRKLMAVRPGRGRKARTSYRILEHLQGSTLVESRLHTGRTHQIRVHFKHLGFPLLGDVHYGKRSTSELQQATGVPADRQMLHARSLEFTHPKTGRWMTFQAPWPEDFRLAVEHLRTSSPETDQ